MNCFNCKYENQCDGAACYYDDLYEQTKPKLEQDTNLYYRADSCNGYTERKPYTALEKYQYHQQNPQDDLNAFITEDQVTSPESHYKWEDDPYWYYDGQQQTKTMITEHGIETVWKDWGWCNQKLSDMQILSDIGYLTEIQRQWQLHTEPTVNCSDLQPNDNVVFQTITNDKLPETFEGHVLFVNTDSKTVTVCYLDGYRSETNNVPFDHVLAKYDKNGIPRTFGNCISGPSVLVKPE